MNAKSISFRILPDGTKVIKEEKEIEIKNESEKRQDKRPRKNTKTPKKSEPVDD